MIESVVIALLCVSAGLSLAGRNYKLTGVWLILALILLIFTG